MKNEVLIIRPSFMYFVLQNWYVPIIITVLFVFRFYFNIYISIFAGVLSVVLLLKCLYDLFVYLSVKFTINNQLIISEYGFLKKSINYMELYRVFDYQIQRNFFENLFGLMTVYIIGRDATSPTLKLFGINFNFNLVPEIRERVEAAKMEKNVYELNQMI